MQKLKSIFLNNIALGLALFYLSPLYIVLVNSFKNREEIYSSAIALPTSLDFSVYSMAIEKMQFFNAFKNSVIVTLGSIFFIIVLSSMTAWMLVRNDNKVSKFIFLAFIATMIIPFQTLMMPMMQEVKFWQDLLGINILDTLRGLIFLNIGFGASMAVFLYHGFIKSSIPVSLEEAATIDGCSTFRVFWSIVFPMLKPTTMTVIILDVIWIWNDFLLPSLVLSNNDIKTIPLSTAKFFGQFTIQWNLAMAGLVLTMIPVIVFYLISQKYIIKGVASGAVK